MPVERKSAIRKAPGHDIAEVEQDIARLPGVHSIECATIHEPRNVLAQRFRNA